MLGNGVLRGQPREVQPLFSLLTDGVSAFEFLTEEYRGTSLESPYRPDEPPGASLPHRIWKDHAEFVRSEFANLLYRGYVVKRADVRGSTGPARFRLVLPLSVEPAKPRLVIDARTA